MTVNKKYLAIIIFFPIWLSCNDNIFDPLSKDGAAVPFISTAKSLTEEGDAHFANGNLEASLKSYEAALEKDAHYEPAITGRVAVKLQIMVREEFPGKKTFTSAILPLLYDSLQSLGSSSTGQLTYQSIQGIPEVSIIKNKAGVFSVIEWAYQELDGRVLNQQSSVLVNMTVLLAYDVIFRLISLLEAVESLQTLSDQLAVQANGDTQFDTDVSSIPVSVSLTGTIDATQLQENISTWRNTYQRLYYIYYFFSNDFSKVEGELNSLNSLLSSYVLKIQDTNNAIIKDIVPQIQRIQGEISNITGQFQKAQDVKDKFEIQVVPNVKILETQIDNLDSLVKNAAGLISSDISVCGLTLQDTQTGQSLSGEIGKTQLDAGSEWQIFPVISDDPVNPCSGNNPRFASPK